MVSEPKKIAKQDITGEKGIALIQTRCLEMGLVFRAERVFDAGVDGTIEIREAATGVMRNYRINVQSKATEGRFTSETGQTFTYTVEERDLNYWLGGNLPTILVRSRPDTSEAYWVWVDGYFKDPERRKSRKIEFHKEKDRFDATAYAGLLEVAEQGIPGAYVQTAPRNETLVSNLMRLASFSDTIYVAPTALDLRTHVLAALGQPPEVGEEWILRSGMIYSFYNLTEPVWRNVCDSGAVEPLPSSEWADSDELPKQGEFVDLMNRALDEKLLTDGIYYNQADDLYYFELRGDQPRIEGSGKSGPGRTVIEVYENVRKKDKKVFKYYRHYALKTRWTRVDGEWYLELTPTYYFTSDGNNKYTFHENQLRGIKRIEKNPAVRYLVEFWGHFLSKSPDIFGKTYPFLSFGALKTFPVDFGFDDASWKVVDEEELPKDLLDMPLFETPEE